jgi:hypothetical protein
MKLAGIALLSVLFSGLAANDCQAGPRRERVVGLKLDSQHINAEAYYNGSSFSGGGIMSAIATVRVRQDGQVWYEEWNVTLDEGTTWASSNPSIYDVEYGNFVESNGSLPDGLYIYGGDSMNIGTTTITVTYAGLRATGSITFWAD